ncbi:MAG: hypothetical protein ACE5HP_02385 [Gemmatimonadota bacterium]
MVWPLTLEAWSLAGLPLPELSRGEIHLHVMERTPSPPPGDP